MLYLSDNKSNSVLPRPRMPFLYLQLPREPVRSGIPGASQFSTFKKRHSSSDLQSEPAFMSLQSRHPSMSSETKPNPIATPGYFLCLYACYERDGSLVPNACSLAGTDCSWYRLQSVSSSQLSGMDAKDNGGRFKECCARFPQLCFPLMSGHS